MTRAELEKRLQELAVDIEAAQTRIWLAEHDRETLRHELRRLLHGAAA
jgi:hypothetical protein